MLMTDDGSHRRCVIVTPLDAPYPRSATVFEFANLPPLAISKKDGDAVRAMFGKMTGKQDLLIAPHEDGKRVLIYGSVAKERSNAS